MRVCIFASTIDKSFGGPARSVPLLANGLSQIGVDVTLLTFQTDDMNTHLLENGNVSLQVLPQGFSIRQLENTIISGNYDVVHLQNLWLPVYHIVVRICRRNNIPYIMTPRGTLEPWSLNQKKLKKQIALMVYQKADLQNAACILTTADMEASHVHNLGIRAPIAVIPNGIDVSEYPCRPIAYKPMVKKQVLFLSRIHPKKGLEILIDAWEHICLEHRDWKLIIAGNGEETYISLLNSKIKEKGLNDSIKIIPPVFGENKRKLYYESAFFVLPSHSENFGMVIAEAMSCGLPVVTTNGTPWQDLPLEGLGWCVDLSEENIYEAISNAIDLWCDELFEKGQRCSKYITEKYQYISIAKKNLLMYEWITNKTTTPVFIKQWK